MYTYIRAKQDGEAKQQISRTDTGEATCGLESARRCKVHLLYEKFTTYTVQAGDLTEEEASVGM
jgi:hypothetical protein